MKISNNILQQQMMQRHFGRKDIIKVGVIKKNNKKPQITGSIEINDAQDSEDLRLVDAIAFDVKLHIRISNSNTGWFKF